MVLKLLLIAVIALPNIILILLVLILYYLFLEDLTDQEALTNSICKRVLKVQSESVLDLHFPVTHIMNIQKSTMTFEMSLM